MMARACTCLLLSLCLMVIRNGYTSEEHLLCKRVKDIFSAEHSTNSTPARRGAQGPPGKKGVPGQKGDRGGRGLPGEPGMPGRVDYAEIESKIEAAVLDRTAEIKAKTATAIERLSYQMMYSLTELEQYKAKLDSWSKRLAIFFSPKEGEIVLVNREGPLHYGRVEIFHSGEWGTICDDDWSIIDANVVCRMLNFTGATAAPVGATYGQGRGKIWLDNVNCDGTESDLSSCSSEWGRHDCSHSEDASVICVQ